MKCLYIFSNHKLVVIIWINIKGQFKISNIVPFVVNKLKEQNMSKLFKINYELSDKSMFTAGVISDTKEKATSFLRTKVPSVARINSITAGGDVHAVDDEIVDRYINNSDKVKKYQDRIKRLNEQMKDYELDIENMREQLDTQQQQPMVSSKDIKEALKVNKSEQPEPEIKKIYVCPYCSFETEKKNGLKMHISKTHKEE